MGRELDLFELIEIAESGISAEEYIAGSTSTEECEESPQVKD